MSSAQGSSSASLYGYGRPSSSMFEGPADVDLHAYEDFDTPSVLAEMDSALLCANPASQSYSRTQFENNSRADVLPLVAPAALGRGESAFTPSTYSGDRESLDAMSMGQRAHRIDHAVPYLVNGTVSFCIDKAIAEATPRWNLTVWAWRSAFSRNKDNYALDERLCMGILACTSPGCTHRSRPRRSASTTQTRSTLSCPIHHCGLQSVSCSVRFSIVKPFAGRDIYIHFTGTHNHAEPPCGKLAPVHLSKMASVVQHSPLATASELKYRSAYRPDGSSESVMDIHPSLINSDVIRYHQSKILQQLGIKKETARGTDRFFSEWRNLQSDFPGVIKFQSFEYGQEVVVMQTPAMASWLNLSWISTNNQNGYVTDAAHKFFREGLLQVTVAFNIELCRWVPVVFSFMFSQSAATYAAHFRVLFQSIHAALPGATDEHYAMVVDYSAAQREGFRQALASHLEEIEEQTTAHHQGRAGLEDRQQARLQRVGALLHGCEYHYDKSVTRVRGSLAMVPFGHEREFASLAMALKTCSLAEFNAICTKIRTTYPNAAPWLEWWTNSTNAPLIFQSCRTEEADELREQLPADSNAVEAMHASIYRSIGLTHGSRRLGTIEGLAALARFSDKLQEEARRVQQGERISYGVQQKSRWNAARFGNSRTTSQTAAADIVSKQPRHNTAVHENDGRPADSFKRAQKFQQREARAETYHTAPTVDGLRFLDRAQQYVSTPWHNNSCYLDSLIEVLYQVYQRKRQHINTILQNLQAASSMDRAVAENGSSTVISGSTGLQLMHALQLRHKAYTEALTATLLQQELAEIRNQVLGDLIEAGYATLGSFGSPMRVLHNMIDEIGLAEPVLHDLTKSESLRYFICQQHGVHLLPRTTKHSTLLLSSIPEPAFPGETLSLQSVIDAQLLLTPQQTGKVHTCLQCSDQTQFEELGARITLPELLVVEEPMDLPTKLEYPAQLQVKSKSSHAKAAHYSLVGRIEYNNQHYTAMVVRSNRSVFHYDGQNRGGVATLLGKGLPGLSQITGVCSNPTSSWYILEAASQAQSLRVLDLQSTLADDGIVLDYDKPHQHWTMTTSNCSKLQQRASCSQAAAATGADSTSCTAGEASVLDGRQLDSRAKRTAKHEFCVDVSLPASRSGRKR